MDQSKQVSTENVVEHSKKSSREVWRTLAERTNVEINLANCIKAVGASIALVIVALNASDSLNFSEVAKAVASLKGLL